MIQEEIEFSVISQRMTVTGRIQGMNGNGLELGRRGCCSRERNWGNWGGARSSGNT